LQEIGNMVLRTVITYFAVLAIMRIMGSREIGKLSVFDFVVSIMIAEIAIISVVEPEKGMLHAVVPMGTLMAIQVLTSIILLKSRTLRLMFDSKPQIVIEKGRLRRDVMRKQRYTLDDLMLQLREQQIASVGDVEFAILEPNGKLSVIRKEDGGAGQDGSGSGEKRQEKEQPASASGTVQFPPKYRFETLPVPLIMDGTVLEENLEKLGKNRFWLRSELRSRGISDVKDVFLCTLDHRGRLFVDAARKPQS
jgi:Predicted membrane protein